MFFIKKEEYYNNKRGVGGSIAGFLALAGLNKIVTPANERIAVPWKTGSCCAETLPAQTASQLIFLFTFVPR
jgi:hypothetical protein